MIVANYPPMTEEQQRFVEKHIGLAKSYCNRTLPPPGYDRDEYLSEILLALCRCAIKFDPSRGISISTYAYAAFQRQRCRLLTHATAAMRDRRRTQGMSVVVADRLTDDTPDPRETLFDCDDARRQVDALLGGLSDRQRWILTQRMAGRTLEDIAQELAVTKERTRQIEAQAFARCRANARRVRMACAGEVE